MQQALSLSKASSLKCFERNRCFGSENSLLCHSIISFLGKLGTRQSVVKIDLPKQFIIAYKILLFKLKHFKVRIVVTGAAEEEMIMFANRNAVIMHIFLANYRALVLVCK